MAITERRNERIEQGILIMTTKTESIIGDTIGQWIGILIVAIDKNMRINRPVRAISTNPARPRTAITAVTVGTINLTSLAVLRAQARNINIFPRSGNRVV